MVDSTGAFATVREMYAVKDELLHELRAMEGRLTDRIDAANLHHDGIHAEMRRRADERHRRIDDFLVAEQTNDAVVAATSEGRSGAFRQVIGILRAANEFRWLIALAVGAILLFGNDIHVSIQ